MERRCIRAASTPTVSTEPTIVVACNSHLKSISIPLPIPACRHSPSQVNLIRLKALPVHVRKKATYSRRRYLGLVLQRDFLVDRLEKGFDRQQIQTGFDRTSFRFST